MEKDITTVAARGQEPVAYEHRISHPELGDDGPFLTYSANNPWSHRASDVLMRSTHTARPLIYAAPPQSLVTWQPIETAPDDQVVDFWIDWSDECAPLNPPMPPDAPYRRCRCKKRGWSSVHKATHWMPLPAPPVSRPQHLTEGN